MIGEQLSRSAGLARYTTRFTRAFRDIVRRYLIGIEKIEIERAKSHWELLPKPPTSISRHSKRLQFFQVQTPFPGGTVISPGSEGEIEKKGTAAMDRFVSIPAPDAMVPYDMMIWHALGQR